ncbi:MAG: PKD domain-containing protein, partial [Candidatus Cloacimonadota bacterium]|nr:PKD domain-containing protein [Candidatus Cloacimonadota bacterium]
MIWQGDTDNISPNNAQRAAMYGVGGIPHAQFDGYTAQIGAGSTIYQTYLQIYNNHINYDSPLDMQLDFGINDSGNMAITADITVTGDIETAANKVVFILSRDITDDYFCSVAFYEFQDFDLTEIGETGTFSQEVVIEDGWDIGNLNAIAMIQTWANYPGTNQHKIIQARQTQYSGILPLFNANITEGPATLNVEFSENSFPIGEIDLFEWDLDGDGVFEEIGTDVSYSYNNEGSYEVSLRITVDGETATTTIPNYITVTDGSEISGSLCGLWSQTNNPYSITDDVLIEEGNELVIEAGTQISLENSAMISVFGKLSANGTIE